MSNKLVRIKNLKLGDLYDVASREDKTYIPARGEIVNFHSLINNGNGTRTISVIGGDSGDQDIFDAPLIGSYIDYVKLSNGDGCNANGLFSLPFILNSYRYAIVTILIPGYMPQTVYLRDASGQNIMETKVFLINQTDSNISSDLENVPYFILRCDNRNGYGNIIYFIEDENGKTINVLYDNESYTMKLDITATVYIGQV